jgi:hypothetical protein
MRSLNRFNITKTCKKDSQRTFVLSWLFLEILCHKGLQSHCYGTMPRIIYDVIVVFCHPLLEEPPSHLA